MGCCKMVETLHFTTTLLCKILIYRETKIMNPDDSTKIYNLKTNMDKTQKRTGLL